MKPVDAQGYPGTIGEDGTFDGGDSAAIIGTTEALGCSISPSLLPWTNELGGRPLRHPDTTKWYGQSDRFSRDQLIPIICAAVRDWSFRYDDLFSAHRKRRFFTAWNTRSNGSMDASIQKPDFTGPRVWALWIRYKRPKWARLVLWILDLESLISALHWRFWREDRVCRNHMLVSITCRKYMPTLVSRLTYWVNDWDDLIERWRGHCRDTKEYDTADLFAEAVRVHPKGVL